MTDSPLLYQASINAKAKLTIADLERMRATARAMGEKGPFVLLVDPDMLAPEVLDPALVEAE